MTCSTTNLQTSVTCWPIRPLFHWFSSKLATPNRENYLDGNMAKHRFPKVTVFLCCVRGTAVQQWVNKISSLSLISAYQMHAFSGKMPWAHGGNEQVTTCGRVSQDWNKRWSMNYKVHVSNTSRMKENREVKN